MDALCTRNKWMDKEKAKKVNKRSHFAKIENWIFYLPLNGSLNSKNLVEKVYKPKKT